MPQNPELAARLEAISEKRDALIIGSNAAFTIGRCGRNCAAFKVS